MNIIRFRFLSLVMLVALMAVAVSCKDDEPPLPANEVKITSSQLGISPDDSEVTITINVSRAANADKAMTITYAAEGVTYGEDFTTEPAASGSTITAVIPKGATSTTLVVKKTEDSILDGDETVTFTVESVEAPFVLTESVTITVTFAQIVSQGAELTLQGRSADAGYLPAAGINYANAVMVDLSANVTDVYDRKNWALGFYSGSEYRVVMNHAFQMLSTVSAKADINAVTVADAQASRLYQFNAFEPSVDASALTLADNFNGSLTGTAIAEVSATDASNLVHFVVTGNGNLNDVTTWYKIRVLRNGNGYTLQYAKVGATTFTSVDIAKNSSYNHIFVSLDKGTDGITVIEPVKANWDIQWSYSTALSSPSFNTPYWVQDFISINNHAGVKVATISKANATEAAAAYDSFTEANLAGLEFVGDRDVIGTKWRSTQPATGVFHERFYIIRDANENYYKLKFKNMGVGGDGGERGRPVIQYELVQQAD